MFILKEYIVSFYIIKKYITVLLDFKISMNVYIRLSILDLKREEKNY